MIKGIKVKTLSNLNTLPEYDPKQCLLDDVCGSCVSAICCLSKYLNSRNTHPVYSSLGEIFKIFQPFIGDCQIGRENKILADHLNRLLKYYSIPKGESSEKGS